MSGKPFYENVTLGNTVEDALWRILNDSGYNAIHFFKEQVDELQQLIRNWDGNATVQRLRCAPDLYVTIGDRPLATQETHFVEVTFRNTRVTDSVTLGKSKTEQLARQLTDWHDSILAIFIPQDPYWCAQNLESLEGKIREATQKSQQVEFNLSTEFRPITTFFSQIKPDKLSGYTKALLRLFTVP